MIDQEEYKATVCLLEFIGDKPVVLDVGSNKGQFSEIILKRFKNMCELHLFEPNEMLLNYTRIKFEYDFNIKYNEVACYNKTGLKIPFYYFTNHNNELSSIYKGGEEWDGLSFKEQIIDTITIDDYCKLNNIHKIDYLKIDAEGSDIDVIFGCDKMLKDGKISILQFEYEKHWDKTGVALSYINNLIPQIGYKMFYRVDDNFIETTMPIIGVTNYYITKLEVNN